MASAVAVLTIAAFVVAWHVVFYRRSGGRTASSLWSAFGTTAASALYLVTGTIGYSLDRHERFVSHTAWTGHVIWPQIGVGCVLALAAALFWRKGLQRIRQEPNRNLRHA